MECAHVPSLVGRAKRLNTKVVIALNSAWNLVNFRSGLITKLVALGYEVVAVAPNDEYACRLDRLGCRYVPLPMDKKGKNPLNDLILTMRYLNLLMKERPAVLLTFTIKPNIYASLAAHMVSVPVVNNIAGLGEMFLSEGLLNKLVRYLYNIALAKSKRVFFQNRDDQVLFVSHGLVAETIVDRLPGSGVDLRRFVPILPSVRAKLKFLMISRMLWNKGVGDFVRAARTLKMQGYNFEFLLLGFVDESDPKAVPRMQIDEWVSEGIVGYLGVSDDVRVQIAEADCIVLPSYYREGTPRTLIEAAAMARPIITTNSVGCRDVVEHGLNGFLCTPKDANDLAHKMIAFSELSLLERQSMGEHGRSKVEREFDEEIVISKYIDVIRSLVR